MCRWDRGDPTYLYISVSGWLLFLGNRSLTGIGDIHCATVLEDFLCTVALFAVFGVDREQDVPVLDLSFVAFRLILRNTHTYKCSGKTAGRCAACRACQSCHDRTRCDANHPAQRSAQYSSRTCTGGSALGSLRVLLVGEVLGALLVGEKNRHVVVGEAR